jgi:hypothetical protein
MVACNRLFGQLLRFRSRLWERDLACKESNLIGQSVEFRLLQIMRSCQSLLISRSRLLQENCIPPRCRTLHKNALRINFAMGGVAADQSVHLPSHGWIRTVPHGRRERSGLAHRDTEGEGADGYARRRWRRNIGKRYSAASRQGRNQDAKWS